MSDLLTLARKFDASTDLEERVRIAEQMKPLLGERYDDFDKAFSLLSDIGPHPAPAVYTAWTLGLVPTVAIIERIQSENNGATLREDRDLALHMLADAFGTISQARAIAASTWQDLEALQRLH